MLRHMNRLLYTAIITITGVFCLLSIKSLAISETTRNLSERRYPAAELISSKIWTKQLQTFHKRLNSNPNTAGTELKKVAQKLFNGHPVTEEWVSLYLRLSRDGTDYLTDVQRISELEIRMLTTIDAEKHALQIQQHQHAMKELTTASAYTDFFRKLPPKAQEILKTATEKDVEILDQRKVELDKRALKIRRESAIKKVKYLRTLSIEKQREYLLERETYQANRPARKKLEVKFPGSIDELWNQELQDLIDAGHTLPLGINFR